jgi:hypothetical protein
MIFNAITGGMPVLLAGSEVILLLKKPGFRMNDSALQYYEQ